MTTRHVQLVVPQWSLPMPWVRQIMDAFSKVGHRCSVASAETQDPDVVLYGWTDEQTVHAINEATRPALRFCFLRRYEFYQGAWQNLNPEKVERVFFVNEVFRRAVEQVCPKLKTELLYNGVDLSKWTFKERSHGQNIAMVGNINERKNIPLALQILERLPEYRLHLFGEVQDYSIFQYIESFVSKTGVSVVWNGPVPNSALDKLLEPMNFILCTATSEGNPNNVLEAMAKGIMSVVHSWPGAEEQFTKLHTFTTVNEAVELITKTPYVSKFYRDIVETKFNGAKNYQRLVEVVQETACQKV